MTFAVEQAAGSQAGRRIVAALAVAMALNAVGNGLIFAFVPVRLGTAGWAPAWAGAAMTGVAGGGIAACFVTRKLVARAGYARAFAGLATLTAAAHLALAAGVDPLLWIAARTLYGFAICALFIVGQSWLHRAVGNAVRGRAMATFYVAYVVGLGFGALLLRFVPLEGAAAPLLGAAFCAVSALPVFGRESPEARERAAALAPALPLRRAWAIAPAGMAAMLAVGGLSMLVTGFTPIHLTAEAWPKADIAMLLFALPFGTLLFQMPLGWLSDRIDRRLVLIAAALVVAAAAGAAFGLGGAGAALTVAIYLVWSGATESLYSIGNAHAADRAEPGELVGLSSAMLLAWSLSGFVLLGLATVLTGLAGTRTFMVMAAVIALLFAGFVAARLAKRPSGVAGG